MARGGKRSGAGRPPAAANKLTRSQKRTLTDIARTHTNDAVRTLVEIMKDKKAPHAARVSASNSVLDRAWGKAPQSITGPGGGPIQTQGVVIDADKLRNMSDDELAALESALGKLQPGNGGGEGGEDEA